MAPAEAKAAPSDPMFVCTYKTIAVPKYFSRTNAVSIRQERRPSVLKLRKTGGEIHYRRQTESLV